MDTQPGDELRRRRRRVANQSEFARAADLNRSQVNKVEKGVSVADHTLAKYEAALDRLEKEHEVSVPQVTRTDGSVEVEITGSFGVRIFARGSREDVDRLLQESVPQLVSAMNGSQPQSA